VTRYFAPAAMLIPEDIDHEEWAGPWGVVVRKWDVSVFDWAELASEHQIRLPWTVADAMLKSCNMEIAVDAESPQVGAEKLRLLHIMLYVQGLHPFSVQMYSDHSINQYAGINARRSSYGRDRLPEGMREGITSKDVTVNVWPAPYVSTAQIRSKTLTRELSPALFQAAVNDCAMWEALRREHPICSFLEDVLLMAPAMPHNEQSLLHIWTGLEAIFPQVQTEVSFRIALYLAQLQGATGDRATFFERARRSYQDRSRVAHGGKPKKRDGYDPWHESWLLLLEIARAIIKREKVPSEEDLVKELLGVAV
jgi:hypothetical protein